MSYTLVFLPSLTLTPIEFNKKVWGRILENLADVGYDGSKMTMESYDWRLSFPKLEERDGYFTKLKYKVEAFHRFSGEKVVLTSHSYGSLLVHYFFAWISAEDEDWVDNHIHCYVNIAGAHLGVPKAASALMSGEMSDTIFMGPFGHLVEQFISRKQRRDLWVTWGSLWTMLPKGGNSLWGKLITMTDADEKHLNDAEDNPEPDTIMHQSMKSFASRANSSASHVIDFLSRLGGGFNPETASDRWHDLLKTPLPHAPNMKIYCLYGKYMTIQRSCDYLTGV
jgi:phospholipid:diacylglycerol acyltransferase